MRKSICRGLMEVSGVLKINNLSMGSFFISLEIGAFDSLSFMSRLAKGCELVQGNLCVSAMNRTGYDNPGKPRRGCLSNLPFGKGLPEHTWQLSGLSSVYIGY